MPNDVSDPSRVSARLLGACQRLLRPLVKALIAHGVTLPTVVATLKQVYVEVAQDSFALDDKPPTDSRISMLTGVHRKDVRALRREGAPAGAAPSMGVSATLIGRWLGDPRYRDAAGQPLLLPRSAPPGQPSFEALVAAISTDIRSRTVLDDLLYQGAVALDEEAQTVRLIADAFLPRPDSEAIYNFYRMNLHDHIAAATENLLNQGETPYLERAVYYQGLTPAAVDALEAEARRMGLAMLHALNAQALAQQQSQAARVDLGETPPDAPAAPASAAARKERLRFGVYFYREPQAPAAPSPDPSSSADET